MRGKYLVTLKTESEKFRADTLGKETSIPVSDYIDLGIFGPSEDNDNTGKVLLMKRMKITQKDNTFTFTLNEKPSQAGIDPYNYLIDRMPEDNLKTVNNDK